MKTLLWFVFCYDSLRLGKPAGQSETGPVRSWHRHGKGPQRWFLWRQCHLQLTTKALTHGVDRRPGLGRRAWASASFLSEGDRGRRRLLWWSPAPSPLPAPTAEPGLPLPPQLPPSLCTCCFLPVSTELCLQCPQNSQVEALPTVWLCVQMR